MCVCGETGVDFQEDPFPVSRLTEQKLTLALVEKCEVKTVNFQQFTPNTSQDTQNNLHSSSSDLSLIIDRSK